MTITRLMLIVSIAIAIIDYKANDGQLMASLSDAGIQWGVWLSEQLAWLANQISPAR